MKKVLVFGSTGSIGRSALEVIRRDRKEFKILGLCADRDIKTLLSQIKEFKPLYVCLRDQKQAKKLQKELTGRIKLFKGEEGLEEFSALDCDISLMAISGISCLKPLLINIRHTKRIALANKESIVTAGALVFKQAKKYNTEILPVDSEINAFFQLIEMNKNWQNSNDCFRRVHITASGGSLANCGKRDFAKVSVQKVLDHPNWNMGRRITVDSATLVNKGFEVIETHFFFGLAFEKINILIHKESMVHAMVECKDNTLFACIYPADMKVPISFALYYPQRSNFNSGINFKNNFSYTFEPINYNRYPLLKIVLEAAKKKDNSLVVLNACDEIAIDYFLKKKIKFSDIYKAVEYIYSHYPQNKIKNEADIFFWDSWAREKTKEYLNKL
ncbi:MAG: 1-deoxy-D-xylulose-5-phosphate reductoisomerase [Candidatus Omnitrophota bacterium]